MRIKVFASRYHLEKGEGPQVLMAPERAEEWYGRDPFEGGVVREDVSDNLQMPPEGTTDGHNLMRDSTFTDSMIMDKFVPVSPLFVKDLAGRMIYTGMGPERKGNPEWARYALPLGPDGEVLEGEQNPFIPLRTFPRFCRDTAPMEGEDLLEQVFLTKFRCLEMSSGYNGKLSGYIEEEDELVNATYFGPNLYPYKLRLDTYYIDGWRLPQTTMVYARGEHEDVRPETAQKLADQLMAAWVARPNGMMYTTWFEALGEDQVEKLYQGGCTLIPTFEASNGYCVVGRNFEIEDYWPGQAVIGLHDVIERRGDKSPAGTILEVLEPGYVTSTRVRPAKVVVSDGSGYVSPNAADPMPLVPNMHLPHPRTLDDWNATWVPTHPEHFEAPALWGWEPDTGRFMQLSGPIWDPLHYYYESVDVVLAAFDKQPLSTERPLVPVPEEMEGRFYPVVPLQGFDTFSITERKRRFEQGFKPLSCLKRVKREAMTAGIGYHPLPAEFEFELDPFWFPDLHPQNRDQGMVPEDLMDRLVPIITPRVTITDFIASVDAPDVARWWTDERLMLTALNDPLETYPQLVRYLVNDMTLEEVVRLCPTPYLGEPPFDLKLPAPAWWLDDNDAQLDSPLALEEVLPNMYDALWDMRQEGAQLVRFRHMVYQTNLPLYNLAWWYGWGVKEMEEAMTDWVNQAEKGLGLEEAV